MAFIRLAIALIGWFFGFFLGASLLEVSQVTPVSNQVLVVFLLAAACAILGWLGAPYVTVLPARWTIDRIREAQAGGVVGGGVGSGVGLVLAPFLAFPLSPPPGGLGRFAPPVRGVLLRFSRGARGTGKRVQQIAGDLEREPEIVREAEQRLALVLARTAEHRAGLARERDQRAGLQPLHPRDRGEIDIGMLDREGAHLPADHAARPDRGCEGRHQFDTRQRIGVRIGFRQHLECARLERVAPELARPRFAGREVNSLRPCGRCRLGRLDRLGAGRLNRIAIDAEERQE